jgi:phosphotransacetylase
MLKPENEKVFIFSDAAVIPEPTSDQLYDIALASADNYKNIIEDTPRIAMLSFSTKGSADHPSIEKIRTAVENIKRNKPEIVIDGEFQFDSAFVPEVAAKKAPGSVIKGDANVFIFPSLEAGNIGYKIAERMGGYSAFGPFIQGLAKPMHDLSRGCSWKDIVNTTIISSCMN